MSITAQQARDMQRSVRLARFSRQRALPRALAAPAVPQALPPDNLLPLAVLEAACRLKSASGASITR
ncbi:hypothetical protein ACR9HU_23900 (plasmid) [Enterobacter ludwigii]